MIPFKGRNSLKQYVKNKPHKCGIKMFARAGSSGFVYDFEVYVGKGTIKNESTLGISGDIVVWLSIGTVRVARMPGCEFISDKELKLRGRGSFDYKMDTNQNIIVAKWYDNKPVDVASNYKGIEPLE
ncbi:piggyBac transposable element-derived protein 2-like [Anthonomus grandis grandis]|uniref:piggyBac transposable element-derived protein 2-like n=1 Tax=Anthonomus grandis grandis TaxID=2921223 RepID=UPI00216602FF|nr:piggyBac transposable element-derived protein 2-like [Anthonomus grandis grandis]